MSADEINYHRHLVIGVETLVKVLSFASFGLRLWARRVSESKLWWDDYIMGIGLVRGPWIPFPWPFRTEADISEGFCFNTRNLQLPW